MFQILLTTSQNDKKNQVLIFCLDFGVYTILNDVSYELIEENCIWINVFQILVLSSK